VGGASCSRSAAFVGRPLSIDEAVYRSESDTGFRNRAIAWMLRNFGNHRGRSDVAAGNYFRQCAIQVSSRDLALMAATLANGGVHPLTRERALPTAHVAKVLAVMATSGMYDYAGSWLYDVGMPAKSGVCGGHPGRAARALGHRRLFARTGTPRATACAASEVCRQLSHDFHLNVFRRLAPAGDRRQTASPAQRSAGTPRAHTGRRKLGAGARRMLQTLSLQATWRSTGRTTSRARSPAWRRTAATSCWICIASATSSAVPRGCLHETRERLAEQGMHLVFARVPAAIGAALDHAGAGTRAGYLSFEDNDLAVEWCERPVARRGRRAGARRGCGVRRPVSRFSVGFGNAICSASSTSSRPPPSRVASSSSPPAPRATTASSWSSRGV